MVAERLAGGGRHAGRATVSSLILLGSFAGLGVASSGSVGSYDRMNIGTHPDCRRRPARPDRVGARPLQGINQRPHRPSLEGARWKASTTRPFGAPPPKSARRRARISAPQASFTDHRTGLNEGRASTGRACHDAYDWPLVPDSAQNATGVYASCRRPTYNACTVPYRNGIRCGATR